MIKSTLIKRKTFVLQPQDFYYRLVNLRCGGKLDRATIELDPNDFAALHTPSGVVVGSRNVVHAAGPCPSPACGQEDQRFTMGFNM
jgi:hypothetical protein